MDWSHIFGAMLQRVVLSIVEVQIPWQFQLIIYVGLAEFPGAIIERCAYFLTPAEQAFFFALELAVGNQLRIAMKVRLGDLVQIRGRDSTAFRNKTDRKHFDFVLCTVREVQPVLVIELEDSSHAAPDRQECDTSVDRSLACGGGAGAAGSVQENVRSAAIGGGNSGPDWECVNHAKLLLLITPTPYFAAELRRTNFRITFNFVEPLDAKPSKNLSCQAFFLRK
jgi:hypothetical protein